MDKRISTWCFTLFALASWRFASLLAEEDGLRDLVVGFRIRAGATFLGRLMDWSCCLSLWFSLPLSIWLSTGWIGLFQHWQALPRAVGLLEKLTRRRELVMQRGVQEGGTSELSAEPRAANRPMRCR
jgi:hypothetical protein